MYAGCKRAWPEILSRIKTYVETVAPLDSNGSTRDPGGCSTQAVVSGPCALWHFLILDLIESIIR
jgi:hypothetical protein